MKQAVAIAILFFSASFAFPANGVKVFGTVKESDGTPFKGAFIHLQNRQTKITTMVLSGRKGEYWVENLAPGQYDIWVTATGYKATPIKRADVNLRAGQNAPQNFSLLKGRVRWIDLTKWQGKLLLPQAPGKETYLYNCFNCHALSKVGWQRHDREGWLQEIDAMRKAGVANINPEIADVVAGYLSSVFGPESKTPRSPASLPNYADAKHADFSDDAMNILFVDYQLTGRQVDRPGTGNPDSQGNIWMALSHGLGKLDPQTGELQTWRLPDPGQLRTHEVLPLPDGNVWLTVEAADRLAKFDTRTHTFTEYQDSYSGPKTRQDPRSLTGMWGSPRKHTAVADHEGNIWASGRPLTRLDPKTGKFTQYPEAPDTYGIAVDQQDNVWFTEFNSVDYQQLGKVDAKTGKITKYLPPTVLSGPRRLKIDAQGNVWFGEYHAGKIARFDPRTETFKEYSLPGASPTPYAILVDHNGYIWYSSMEMGTIGRLDPRTGAVLEFPTPYTEAATRDFWEDSSGRIWYGAEPYLKLGYFQVRQGGSEVSQR